MIAAIRILSRFHSVFNLSVRLWRKKKQPNATINQVDDKNWNGFQTAQNDTVWLKQIGFLCAFYQHLLNPMLGFIHFVSFHSIIRLVSLQIHSITIPSQ